MDSVTALEPIREATPRCTAVDVADALLDAGADLGIRPFGLEPQRILRLQKMHILVGQDTDSESTPFAAAMPWIVKFDKDDFVGKWSLEHVRQRGFREQLVGFEMANGTAPRSSSASQRCGAADAAQWS